MYFDNDTDPLTALSPLQKPRAKIVRTKIVAGFSEQIQYIGRFLCRTDFYRLPEPKKEREIASGFSQGLLLWNLYPYSFHPFKRLMFSIFDEQKIVSAAGHPARRDFFFLFAAFVRNWLADISLAQMEHCFLYDRLIETSFRVIEIED